MDDVKDDHVSDDELVRRGLAGSEEAKALLYTRYVRRILRYIYRMTLDLPSSEDMTHDTFVRFFEGMDRYEPRGRLAAYLFTIARRVVVDHLRRKTGDAATALPVAETSPPPPDQVLEAAELRERALAALMQLPDKFREVVVLRIYDGMSYADIAEITGIGESTLRSRLLYALEEMRSRLRR